MKILINVSNHPSEGWSEEQKKGWDGIVDIQFPAVDPGLNEKEIWALGGELVRVIENKMAENSTRYIMLQGEFSLCAVVQFLLSIHDGVVFCYPTTERKVTVEGDKKISIFRFKRWRMFDFSKIYKIKE